jgi:hypothetical protein
VAAVKEWKEKAFESAAMILVVAIIARLVWSLLQPAVPVLVILLGLVLIYATVFRRHE